MRKIAILIFCVCLVSMVEGQRIDNRINIGLSRSHGNLAGAEVLKDGNFIAPSLFGNYKVFAGAALKGLVKVSAHLSLGMQYDLQTATNWSSQKYDDFNNAKARLHSITPLVRIHNRFKSQGFANKVQLFIEAGPTVGYTKLILEDPVFEVKLNKPNWRGPVAVLDRSIFGGFKGSAGAEYSIHQSFGLFAHYTYSRQWTGSVFYIDRSIESSMVHIGLTLKLNKDKHFYY